MGYQFAVKSMSTESNTVKRGHACSEKNWNTVYRQPEIIGAYVRAVTGIGLNVSLQTTNLILRSSQHSGS
jgi:hypothetical protein